MATTVAPTEGVEAHDAALDEDAPAPRSAWYGDGLGLLLAGALAFVAARPLVDNSFLTHLATGRVMLESGFPRANPFLYSSTDFPIPSWWWSGVLALVDQMVGGAGIRLLTMAMAAALGALVVRLARPVTPSEHAAGVLSIVLPVTCVFITLMPFLNARPQLPGYLMLGLTVLVVRERRSPWWLLPVFATWVNIHGTWFYGLAVLGLLLVCQAIDDRRIEQRQIAFGGTALLGVVVGGAVYPEPFRLVGLPFEQFGDERARTALSLYMEWSPAGWGHPLTWLLVAMGLVAVVGAVRRRAWGSLLGTVVLMAMGLSAGRLLPLAAITLVPWVATSLAGLGSLSLPRGRVAAGVALTGGCLVALGVVWSVRPPAYDLSRYPVAAVDWLSERDLVAQPDVRVASHDYVGNYLDWRFADRANTFVDDRSGIDALLDYAALRRFSDDWPDALDRADPDVVVWETDQDLTEQLAASDDWYEAGTFDDFTVFCRSSIADRCR